MDGRTDEAKERKGGKGGGGGGGGQLSWMDDDFGCIPPLSPSIPVMKEGGEMWWAMTKGSSAEVHLNVHTRRSG